MWAKAITSAYVGLQNERGLYFDGIAKINLFENDIKGRMKSGGYADNYEPT